MIKSVVFTLYFTFSWGKFGPTFMTFLSTTNTRVW